MHHYLGLARSNAHLIPLIIRPIITIRGKDRVHALFGIRTFEYVRQRWISLPVRCVIRDEPGIRVFKYGIPVRCGYDQGGAIRTQIPTNPYICADLLLGRIGYDLQIPGPVFTTGYKDLPAYIKPGKGLDTTYSLSFVILHG